MAGSYVHGIGSPYRPNRYQSHSQLYTQTPPSSTDNLSYNQSAMNNLAQAFGQQTLSSNASMGMGKTASNSMAANSQMLGMQSTNQPFYSQYSDANMILYGMAAAQAPYGQYSGNYSLGYTQPPFLDQQAYAGYGAPMTQEMTTNQHYGNWTAQQQVPIEVPELTAPRRNSLSSNEESGQPMRMELTLRPIKLHKLLRTLAHGKNLRQSSFLEIFHSSKSGERPTEDMNMLTITLRPERTLLSQ